MCISHWKNQSLSQFSYPGSALVGCWEITQPASNMKSFPKLLKHQFSWNYQFLKAWGIKFFPVPLKQYKNYQKSEPVPGTWWGTVLPAPLGHSFHTNCIFMSLSLPAEFSQWCLAEPEIWELPQSYPRRCIHRPVTGEWDPRGSPLAGSKLSLALVLSSSGFWPAETEDRESPTSLDLLCFWSWPGSSKVSKKPHAGFSSLSFLTGHQHSPGKNPLFCIDFVQVNVWTTLGGARGRDGSRGWALWNEEVALCPPNTSWSLVWISSWTHRDFIPSHICAPALCVHLAAPHSYPVSFCISKTAETQKSWSTGKCLCCTLSFCLQLHKSPGTQPDPDRQWNTLVWQPSQGRCV